MRPFGLLALAASVAAVDVHWTIPMDPKTMTVSAGEKVTFKWETYHDLVTVPTKAAFDACDHAAEKTVLAGTSVGGEFAWTAPDTPGRHFFVCSVGQPGTNHSRGHCAMEQKLEVVVVVDRLTVDWKIPTTPAYRVVSPGALVTFKWGGFHDVAISATRQAFDACDHAGSTALAAAAEGGEVTWTAPDEAGRHYFVCTVGNKEGHCAAGQKLEIIVDAATVHVDWKIPMNPQTLAVSTGAHVTFKWETYHDLVTVPTKAAFDTCDHAAEKAIIAGTSVGGEVTWLAPDTEGTHYFVCSVGQAGTGHQMGHCAKEQKLAVHVHAKTPTHHIPAVAQGTGTHSTFLSLLMKANLLETMQGDGPFTVFAPTNEAFAAVGIAYPYPFDSANPADIKNLTDILTYHVMSGKMTTSGLSVRQPYTMLSGKHASFSFATIPGGTLKINGNTNIVVPDVHASNGVVHVIDTVLFPPRAPASQGTGDNAAGMHAAGVASVMLPFIAAFFSLV